MSEERKEFFFSYKGGNSRQVTKEEWEKEWRDWWERSQSDVDSSDVSSLKNKQNNK